MTGYDATVPGSILYLVLYLVLCNFGFAVLSGQLSGNQERLPHWCHQLINLPSSCHHSSVQCETIKLRWIRRSGQYTLKFKKLLTVKGEESLHHPQSKTSLTSLGHHPQAAPRSKDHILQPPQKQTTSLVPAVVRPTDRF